MFEPRIYDGIGYRVWTGNPKFFSNGHIELRVTPDNLSEIAMRADELFNQIKFDAIRLYYSDGLKFDPTIQLAALVPYVKSLILEDGCQKIDFTQFSCLTELLSLTTWDKNPKNLLLRNFPKLASVTLGQVSDVNILANAISIEDLGLYRKLHIAKTGWQWLGSLPNLKSFYMIQFEMRSLEGIPLNTSIEKLIIGYPRTFVSLDGIGAFSNVQILEIEGARQISDISPISDLKKLRQLIMIGCAKPKSWDFLKLLPNLEWVNFDGHAVWGNGELTKRSFKLIQPA